MRLPVVARLYVCIVIATGAAVVAASVPSVQFPRPLLFAALLILSVVSSALKVDMPLGVGTSSISLSYAVDFTALLLLGPAPTMLIAMASGWSQCTFRMNERNPAYKTLFSMASLALTVAAAGATHTWLGGTLGNAPHASLQPLMAAAMTYFLVNSLTVATAVALVKRRPIFGVWHDNFLWSITSYVVGGVAAGIAVEVFQQAGQWQTGLAFVPLCLTYRTYRIYLARIADEQRQVAEWTQLHRESMDVLARAIQAKDNGSSHVERVQYYAAALARHLELPEKDAQAVEIAALLHDIGKLAVPEHILSKPGPLTPNERMKMQIHAQVGAEIVSAVPFPSPVAPLIRSHHERWDGTGYPSGLRNNDIPVGARILAVVDCFDALTSERPYRRAMSPEDALAFLREQAGKAFDPRIVTQFTELLPVLRPPSNGDSARKIRHGNDGASGEHTIVIPPLVGTDAFAKIASANRESYTLYEIAQAMGRSMSLAETMTLVSSKLSALVPFSSCTLFVRADDDSLRCRFATGLHGESLEHATINAGRGLSGWVARHERPLVNGAPRVEFIAAGIAVQDMRLQSALVCPLSVGDRVIGTIGVFHTEAESYTEDHRRVLDEISKQAAAVVHNALMFEHAQEQAFKDGLTGLANPRALQFQIARELARARRASSEFSLVLLDLDDFKTINDQYGHVIGDRALQEVARTLQQTTRPYDTCIRYGGDEFIVLLASVGRAEAEERRRRLQEEVAAITVETSDGCRIPLRASAGASTYPTDGLTYERLLARADRRMYRDKAQRKGTPGGIETAVESGVLPRVAIR